MPRINRNISKATNQECRIRLVVYAWEKEMTDGVLEDQMRIFYCDFYDHIKAKA